MNQLPNPTGSSEGEAIIRRALRRSLLSLVLLAAIVVLGYWLTRAPQDTAPSPTMMPTMI